MDNFRKPKPRSNRPTSGIDGVIGGRSRHHPAQRPAPMPAQSIINMTGSKAINEGFRRGSGFHGTAQPSLWPGEEVLRVPLETEPAAKKRRLKFLRRKKSLAQTQAPKKRSVKRLIYRSILTIILLAVITGGYLAGKGALKLHNILRGGSQGAIALDKNADPAKLKGEGDGRVNILLLGRGGPGWDGPDLTDTIIVASIDPIQNDAALLSIPRDLFVKPSGFGYMKINAVFANAKYSYQAKTSQSKEDQEKGDDAGFALLEDTIKQYIGLPINYHAIIDFEGFKKAIDTVGGITINVTKELNDPTYAWENGGNPVLASVGVQNFDGKHALMFARSRKGSVRGDFDRAERQRQLIVALRDKILSLGTFGNPIKISQLIDAFGDHIRTNFTLNELLRVYDIAKSIDGSNVTSVGLADPPNNFVVTDNVNGESIVRPRAGLDDFSEIQNYIRNALRDGFLKSENANLTVLNGTNTAGLGAKKATELRSFGYTVTKVDNAPTREYAKTVIIDLSNGAKKYTKSYLEKRFGVTAVTAVPDSKIVPIAGTDFIIILGQNDVASG